MKWLVRYGWVTAALASLALAEMFRVRDKPFEPGEREREWLEELLSSSPDEFWYSVSAASDSGSVRGVPVWTFDQYKDELQSLGYDCAEIHRGVDRDLFEQGVIKSCNADKPEEIVAGRFVRRIPRLI